MLQYFDFYQFIGGLGLFFLGMIQLEYALKHLAGRKFRQFLREQTKGRLKSVMAGAIVTAVLQSSSLVSLLTLAFIGSGLMSLYSAIGVVVGANLGTTLTGWIFTIVGFKFDIQNLALLMLGLGAFFYFLLEKKTTPREIARSLMGFGLLFTGLDGMKVSISHLAKSFDITIIAGQPLGIYFLVGFLLTAIIQSSSACMVIVLSALNAGLIKFESAAAMVLGADLGTTITVFFGAIKGSPDKKRLALSHFIYNLVIDITTLFCLPFLTSFIFSILGIQDYLIALVTFHSLFNLLGIFLIFPFLKSYTNWLEKFFLVPKQHLTTRLDLNDFELAESTLELIEAEVEDIFFGVLNFNFNLIKFPFDTHKFKLFPHSKEKNAIENYHDLKTLEGEIYEYSLKIKKQYLQTPEVKRLDQLLVALRSLIYSAKGIKDIIQNLSMFSQWDERESQSQLNHVTEYYSKFLHEVKTQYQDNKEFVGPDFLHKLKAESQKLNRHLLASINATQTISIRHESDFSTYFNIVTELNTSSVSLLRGIEDLTLDKSRSLEIQEHTEII